MGPEPKQLRGRPRSSVSLSDTCHVSRETLVRSAWLIPMHSRDDTHPKENPASNPIRHQHRTQTISWRPPGLTHEGTASPERVNGTLRDGCTEPSAEVRHPHRAGVLPRPQDRAGSQGQATEVPQGSATKGTTASWQRPAQFKARQGDQWTRAGAWRLAVSWQH